MPELYGLLLYLFLKLPGMTAYPTVFPISIKIEKKVTFNSCLNLFFFLTFSLMAIYYCFIIVLRLEIHGVFMRFFSVI